MKLGPGKKKVVSQVVSQVVAWAISLLHVPSILQPAEAWGSNEKKQETGPESDGSVKSV